MTKLSDIYPTYRGPGPNHGSSASCIKAAVTHLFVATCWQMGILLNIFNVLQPTPSLPQVCLALPVMAVGYFTIYRLLGSSAPLSAVVIGGLILFASLPKLGVSLPYMHWVHRLLVDMGDYWRDGAHSCYEFELSKDLPVGIWCYHPHGMFSWFMSSNHLRHGLHEYFDKQLCPSVLPRQGLAVRILCDSPLFRHLIVDTVRSTWPADKTGMSQLMGPPLGEGEVTSSRRREAVALVPGGFHEAAVTTRGKHRVVIKRKKGFVKLALRSGYALYPCYVFGEAETYVNPQFGGNKIVRRLRQWLADYNVPTILPIGEWFCPMLPKRDLGLYSVVGKPILLPTIASPTQSDIDKYHTLYVDALVQLFDRNKANFGFGDAELEVF